MTTTTTYGPARAKCGQVWDFMKAMADAPPREVCLPLPFSRDANLYPQAYNPRNGRAQLAVRIIWELATDAPCPPVMEARNLCGNGPSLTPPHRPTTTPPGRQEPAPSSPRFP